ncbi:MAG: RluA family pseudouridine synthase [Oscillospiraceae bacterium]|nr:RluA family pseudouridine synthase [Oscillospiraceae bacterium]
MREYIINSNDAGQRLDKFLTKTLPAMPKSAMYKAIRKKDIKLNAKRCDISDCLKEGDVLRVYIKDDVLGEEKKNEQKSCSFLKACDISSDIVYEDDNIMIINKKCGSVIHPDKTITENTIVDRVKKYLYEKNEYSPQDENSFAPAVCNRLDRNTQGLVIAAKNAAALRAVNEKIRNSTISKHYLCLSASMPPKMSDKAYAYHRKDGTTNKVTIRAKPCEGYKQIITGYTVVKRLTDCNLIDVELFTGRTHQIRAHLAFLGCPIIGDAKYGSKTVNEKFGLRYQALCAYKLIFMPDSEPGLLSYLDSKSFEISDIWFSGIK